MNTTTLNRLSGLITKDLLLELVDDFVEMSLDYENELSKGNFESIKGTHVNDAWKKLRNSIDALPIP